MPTERGRELDAAIHQDVIGRPVLWVYGQLYDADSGLQVDRYSSDANAARLVLQEIERRGLRREMSAQLRQMFFDGTPIPNPQLASFEEECEWEVTREWKFLAATPEAICLSALTAVRGGKG